MRSHALLTVLDGDDLDGRRRDSSRGGHDDDGNMLLDWTSCERCDPGQSRKMHILLKGPGLSHRKMPLDGISMAIALPNQYDKTSKNSVETSRVCGLK